MLGSLLAYDVWSVRRMHVHGLLSTHARVRAKVRVRVQYTI